MFMVHRLSHMNVYNAKEFFSRDQSEKPKVFSASLSENPFQSQYAICSPLLAILICHVQSTPFLFGVCGRLSRTSLSLFYGLLFATAG